MPFRIQTDLTLRRACGQDGAAWASAYLANQTGFEGDKRHIELAAWFDAAISTGALLAPGDAAAMPAKLRDGLRLALDAVGGNQSELARICGCTQGAIWQMLNRPDPRLSVRFVLKVEEALGISRTKLRPDYYPEVN